MSEIEYSTDLEGVQACDLQGFFEGWPKPPSPETHLHLLQRSSGCVRAVDTESGRTIGFVNVLTDGVLSAYIPLLEVLPGHRGRGIGAELIRRALDLVPNIYMVDVTCDAGIQPFYESMGFTKSTGACLRRYERQSGSRAQGQSPGN